MQPLFCCFLKHPDVSVAPGLSSANCSFVETTVHFRIFTGVWDKVTQRGLAKATCSVRRAKGADGGPGGLQSSKSVEALQVDVRSQAQGHRPAWRVPHPLLCLQHRNQGEAYLIPT